MDTQGKETDMSNEDTSKFRYKAALAFAVASCDHEGIATDNDIRYAVEQADRLIKKLEEGN